MKLTIQTLIVTFAVALIAGCSEDLERGGAYKPEKGVAATIPAYPFDNGTRVNISNDLQTFTWSDGDKLGLYYQGSTSTAHAGFTITAGGGSTGNFVNEAFILKPSSTYYAFYPFNEKATIASTPVDFTGQVQTANGSTSHLGAYNYMYTPVTVNSEGRVQINFKNVGTVMQIDLTVPKDTTYTELRIISDNAVFITKGTVSMNSGSITSTETSKWLSLKLGSEGLSLKAGDILTANILIAPVDMSQSNLTFALQAGSSSTEYRFTTAGRNMLQGKAYKYTGSCEPGDVEIIGVVFNECDTISFTNEYQLKWTVFPENSNNKDVTFEFEQQENKYYLQLNVSETGLVTIQSDSHHYCLEENDQFTINGKLKIRTGDNKYTDEIYIEGLHYVPVAGIEIVSHPDSPICGVDNYGWEGAHYDGYHEFSINVLPSNASDQRVIVTSSDATIATAVLDKMEDIIPNILLNYGYVYLNGEDGDVTITVTTVDGGYSASFTLKCLYGYNPYLVSFGNGGAMKIGTFQDLQIGIFPPKALEYRDYDFIYNISDTSVVTIENGMLHAIGVGIAEIEFILKDVRSGKEWSAVSGEIKVLSEEDWDAEFGD